MGSSKNILAGRGEGECIQRWCIDAAAAAALTLTICVFSWLPQSKLSIAAARRPVFVSALQHCKFGAAELARRFSVKGRVLVQCFGRATTIQIDPIDWSSQNSKFDFQFAI